jgi:NADH dehydrogenase/NADH:ubiquinone oxidoreductase subunit G
MQKRLKPSEMLFVCGNNVDVETSQMLKKIALNNNIDLISEQFLETKTNLLSNLRLNTTFSEILYSDLCITFGTNVRFEASLLNVRLKKRSKMGNFIKASVGLTENLNYSNITLGNSVSTLIQISEGRHPFCKSLAKAKNPMIILGSGIKKRLDSDSITKLVDSLSKHINLKHEE